MSGGVGGKEWGYWRWEWRCGKMGEENAKRGRLQGVSGGVGGEVWRSGGVRGGVGVGLVRGVNVRVAVWEVKCGKCGRESGGVRG